MSARKVIGWYWLGTAAVAVAYLALPTWHVLTWGLIGASTVAAVLFGTVRNRPRRALLWGFVAAGLFAYIAGDTTYNVLAMLHHQPNPYPSVADAVYLAVYPLLGAGLFGLAKSGAHHRDRVDLLDAVSLTASVTLLAWIFLIHPYLVNSDLQVIQKAVSCAYPIGDILLLAAIARLVTVAANTRAVLLLAAGTVFLFATDAVYSLMQLAGTWRIGTPLDLGWAISYAAFGAAAIHPSMTQLTEPRLLRPAQTGGARLRLLVSSSLIPPAVLLFEAVRGQVHDGVVIALFSALAFALVSWRLAGVIDTHRRVIARERALREAGAALVAATEAEEVERVVRASVANLLPAGVDYRLLLLPQTPAAVSGTGASLRYTRSLDPEVSARLRDFDVVLCCPLRLEDRPSGRPEIGVLVLAAAEIALVGLEGAIDVLAAQAALATERIGLSNEIYRRRSEEYFRTLVLNAADVILILDDDDVVRYASPSAVTLFGTEDLARRGLVDLVCPTGVDAVRASLAALRRGATDPEVSDWSVRRGAGELAQVEVSYQDLRSDPTVAGIVATLRDVTDRRRLERELTHQAYHDALTDLANRALFQDRMREAIARSGRRGLVVGVLVIDLDDFKIVNETLGHGTGDKLLVAVAQRICSAVRGKDVVARLGGDEFAILVEGASGIGEVDQVAERVLQTFAVPLVINGQTVSCAASIGLTTSLVATDGPDLLSQADLALYSAKNLGKGRSVRYQPALHAAMRQRLELRAEIDQSLTDGDFVLHYQPIVRLGTGEPVGFEALVRWNHPVRGFLPPGQFIDVAEESGLIVPLGSWVLRESIATVARWRQECSLAQRPYMSVNVSARQFQAPNFIDEVMRDLLEFELDPKCLLLEITESLLLRDNERVWTDLLALRAAGVRVAIDDFGTGYSSLSYLRQVPIDIVKIDKSFVDTISTSKQQRALVNGIVGLAHDLGLQVVAEGIERTAERDALSDMGCALGQGFLFAKPMSYSDAVSWMQATEAVG